MVRGFCGTNSADADPAASLRVNPLFPIIALHQILHSPVQDRHDILRQLVDVSHRLSERRFVAATDGNVSARLPSGTVLITPSGINKGRVSEADIVEVRMDGSPVIPGRRPSTELDLHLFIYERRPEIGAVIHAHPVHATAFAVARIPMTDAVLPEVIVGLGGIPLAPYATPSTAEVRASLEPFVKRAHAVLLANHGVVTMGRDLDEAWFRMEKVEQAAEILFAARALGGECRLTGAELERLRAISRTSYGKDLEDGYPCEPESP